MRAWPRPVWSLADVTHAAHSGVRPALRVLAAAAPPAARTLLRPTRSGAGGGRRAAGAKCSPCVPLSDRPKRWGDETPTRPPPLFRQQTPNGVLRQARQTVGGGVGRASNKKRG